jgi:hypothetical protein
MRDGEREREGAIISFRPLPFFSTPIYILLAYESSQVVLLHFVVRGKGPARPPWFFSRTQQSVRGPVTWRTGFLITSHPISIAFMHDCTDRYRRTSTD